MGRQKRQQVPGAPRPDAAPGPELVPAEGATGGRLDRGVASPGRHLVLPCPFPGRALAAPCRRGNCGRGNPNQRRRYPPKGDRLRDRRRRRLLDRFPVHRLPRRRDRPARLCGSARRCPATGRRRADRRSGSFLLTDPDRPARDRPRDPRRAARPATTGVPGLRHGSPLDSPDPARRPSPRP
jgi:hypothetical protein